MDVPAVDETLLFEDWQFDRRTGRLLRWGTSGAWAPVKISWRALKMLAVLLEQPGALVSKDELMDAAWPNLAVAPNNLTVQMAALRQVLDEGRSGQSCIQTVSGRGYRFVLPASRVSDVPDNIVTCAAAPEFDAVPAPLTTSTSQPKPHAWRRYWPSAILGGAILLIMLGWHAVISLERPTRPRLSIVVLPFENLSDDRDEDYLADGITDDLTTDLGVRSSNLLGRAISY